MKNTTPNKQKLRYNRATHTDPDVSMVSQRLLVELSGWSQSTIAKLDELPRNEDLSYDLKKTMPVLVGIAEGKNDKDTEDLENQKLRLQCEKLEIDVDRLKREMITLALHEQILCSRADSFKRYIQEFFKRNCHLYAHKSIDQLRPIIDKHIVILINNYAQNHK